MVLVIGSKCNVYHLSAVLLLWVGVDSIYQWGGSICPTAEDVNSTVATKEYARLTFTDGSLMENDSFAVTIQCHHNKFRQAAGLASLKWNQKLALFSNNWTQSLRFQGCKKVHSSLASRQNLLDFDYVGENLYWFKTPDPIPNEKLPVYGQLAVETWVYEMRFYSYGMKSFNQCPIKSSNESSGSEQPQTDFFTQVMWDTTTDLGCDFATCHGDTVVVACAYGPGGLTIDHPVFNQNAFCELNKFEDIAKYGGPLTTCSNVTITCA